MLISKLKSIFEIEDNFKLLSDKSSSEKISSEKIGYFLYILPKMSSKEITDYLRDEFKLNCKINIENLHKNEKKDEKKDEKRERAIQKLEYLHLKFILNDREYIKNNLPEYLVDFILSDVKLMDIVISSSEAWNHNYFINDLGLTLLKKFFIENKIKKSLGETITKWYDMDNINKIIILASSLKDNGDFDKDLLIERINTRIRSDKRLTKILKFKIIENN